MKNKEIKKFIFQGFRIALLYLKLYKCDTLKRYLLILLRGILSLLIDTYELNVEFIAKVAHVEEQYVVDFMNGVGYLPTEVKYSICTTAMNLSLIFKNTEI
ncbi:HTH domain-containing protein [Clostridioides sp. ZZV14-5902]|uniref:HTH domain-containing protein n=1 Tax=Clostridioides sp. ZZV14-5902 TaxID=2811486 RepID=UPI001D110673|nr:hypothetical protein [Clostridioides sp. ZZV14-5902]WLD27869.1 hypothetical protein CDIFMA2_17510 [Clostridioides difficile]